MRSLRALVIGLLGCLAGLPAWGGTPATLKQQIQLDAGVIKVADIWADAGAKAGSVVGPAPPPGRSIAIEAAQLIYIARLYDVEWHAVSGVERTSIERAGRPLTRDELAEPIRRSLVDAGASATSSVEFANFAPIQVPPTCFPTISVEAVSYDGAGDHFVANVVVAADGMATARMRMSGQVLHLVTALVASHRLTPGDVIGPDDVHEAKIAERRVAGAVVADIGQAVGQTPRRVIVAGQPLAVADIGPPMLVAKGETVVISVETPQMSLALQGLALGSGGRDDVIQVMNPLSRAVVAARVTGSGRAMINPGTAPLVAAAGNPQRTPEVAN